jgi:hypothetical protein
MYPHLQLPRVKAPTVVAKISGECSYRLPDVAIEQNKIEVEPVKDVEIKQIVQKVVETPTIDETPTVDERPVKKPKVKKPKSSDDLLELPIRETQIPIKGERGLQKKFSIEQRKKMYVDRLSRKSIRKAEVEIGQVDEILTSVENDKEKLIDREKNVKRELKLINYAKYFIDDS